MARSAVTVRHRRASRTPYLLLAPSAAILLLAMGYPLAWQLLTSTQKFGLAQQFGKPPESVGLANYVTLFTDSYLWTVVLRSVVFCLANAFVTVLVGVLVALLMKAVGTLPRLALQVSMLLAWSMPVVAAMTVWRWLFDWNRGVVNWVLTWGGLDFIGHNWLEKPLSFFFVASTVIVWMSVPFVALSVYAGLTQVPDEVIEAAQIDGANAWQRFWGIVVPMVRPVLMIVLLLQIIWDLRVFAQIKLLQDAGSTPSETNLLGTYIFQLGTGSQNFGMASAVSVFVLALTVALSWFYVRILLKEDA
ncbi:carbohydrate ABC transporter permease [Cellulomonas sp. P24]|uniref:carbohydrate ABC transporter permease n=1 Tax=Cellulomonas sp. P24 TaxID=2885206 RepID=UPI00216B3E07|nr:sugar ABC transporter permease [Cellulomonas sp. P24]MCR6491496.1 sugar ABC transporter permease [Cellulomonas sp. P24]